MKKILLPLLFILLGLRGNAQACLETFDGWDGTTEDWLPDGWTEEHTDEDIPALAGGQYTWHVIDPNSMRSMPAPRSGQYYAAIGFAKDADGMDLYQDEWLISPAYQLSEYGGTLSFAAAYSPLYLHRVTDEFVDWDNYDFLDRQCSADLQIWVRLYNKETQDWDLWVNYESCYADWCTQPIYQLLNQWGSIDWHNYANTIFLTEEEHLGAIVQVAFRYVGQYGYNVGLDDFRMGYATQVADPTTEGLRVPMRVEGTSRRYDISGRADAPHQAHGISIITRPDGSTHKIIR